MGRLIDADRLKAHYCWWAGGSKEMSIDEAKKTFDTIIDIQPTVDAVPLEDYKSMEQTVNKLTNAIADAEKHGHWCVTQAYPHTVYCSECFQRFAQAHWAVWEDGSLPRDYCPHCGAKMDGERREDATD